jgi:hypothetical protein
MLLDVEVVFFFFFCLVVHVVILLTGPTGSFKFYVATLSATTDTLNTTEFAGSSGPNGSVSCMSSLVLRPHFGSFSGYSGNRAEQHSDMVISRL